MWTKQLVRLVVLSFVVRLSCYGVMLWVALWAEALPASGPIPDRVLDLVPYVQWVDAYNYAVWIAAYVPVGLVFMWKDPHRFVRYMVLSGLVALFRAGCIIATGLGPVHEADRHVGMSLGERWDHFVELGFQFGIFAPETGRHFYLVKDLYFSGHTATTFLLLLYVWRHPRLRWWMLAGHLAVVATLFLSHLHYTIDVLGAYTAVLAAFALAEGRLGLLRARYEAAP